MAIKSQEEVRLSLLAIRENGRLAARLRDGPYRPEQEALCVQVEIEVSYGLDHRQQLWTVEGVAVKHHHACSPS